MLGISYASYPHNTIYVLGSLKVRRHCVISLVTIAVVLLSLIGGITFIYTHQRVEEYPIFSTRADEANAVFGRQRVWLMSSVCMIDIPEDYHVVMDFTLYHGDCADTTIKSHITHINNSANKSVGFFFFFLPQSSVDVSYTNGQSGISKWKMSKNPKKAKDLECGDGTVFQGNFTAHDSGYYHICIIPKSATVDYRMNITQYYHGTNTNNDVCDDIIQGPDHEHKCCHFSFWDTFSRLRCVYLTADGNQPQPLSSPNEVKVYMRYNNTVRTLTIVGLVVAIVASCVVIVAVCCVQFRVRRLEPA